MSTQADAKSRSSPNAEVPVKYMPYILQMSNGTQC